MNTEPHTIEAAIDEELMVGLYYHHHNFQKTKNKTSPTNSFTQYTYSMDFYVLINKGSDIEERIDFGKERHAVDFYNAYTEQRGYPKVLFLNLTEVTRPEGIWGPNFSVGVEYGYSKDNLKNTVSFPFPTAAGAKLFNRKVATLHHEHLDGKKDFYYQLIKEAADRIEDICK